MKSENWLDLSNYAKKKVDLKNGVDTSKSIKKFDLAKVKSEVDKLEK